MKYLLLLPLLFFTHCAHNQALKPVTNKAAFDLSCPKEKLNVTELSHDGSSGSISYGVVGCGKKASYICMRKVFGNAVCIKESETVRGR